MKKLITTCAVAAMTTVGLVGIAPQANAACDEAYNKCENTKPKADADVKKKGKVKIELDIKNKEGKPTSVPKGTASFTCVGPNDTPLSFAVDVNGSTTTTQEFKPRGAWTCSIAFEPDNPKKFGPSSTSISFDNGKKDKKDDED